MNMMRRERVMSAGLICLDYKLKNIDDTGLLSLDTPTWVDSAGRHAAAYLSLSFYTSTVEISVLSGVWT